MFEEKGFSPTPISQLGEFGLIQRVTSGLMPQRTQTIKGVGDDCAVMDLGGNEYLLMATDVLAEGIHFDLRYVPLKHLGFKAVAVNLSDIYAMNGKPLAVTISLCISAKWSVEAVEELYEGIRFACESHRVDLVGGDTSSSSAGSFINVSIIGTVPKVAVVYRSGAQVHDLVCVTGDLGAAYAGLQVLERELKVFQGNSEAQPDLEQYDYVVGRQLKPVPRWDVIQKLAEAGVKPTSMIDVSDGLASDLLHISAQSQVGVRIFQDKIPLDHQTVSVAEEFNLSPLTFALNGGEDYELLFTARGSDFDKLKSMPEISVIGHITEEGTGTAIHLSSGETVPLTAQGWNHFK